MPALPLSQESDWNNNVYVLATTRIFVIIGMGYLIKSLCHLVPWIWGTRASSIAAGVAGGIDLGDIISDTSVTVPDAVGTGLDLEANLTVDIRPPQPSYDPHASQSHAESSRVGAPAHGPGMEVPDGPPPIGARAMQEENVAVCNNDHHIEEGVDIAVGLTR